MTNAIRYLLMTVLSIGMVIIAVMFFWVFLLILGVLIIGRMIYMKLFNKSNKNAVTFYSYTMYNGRTETKHHTHPNEQKSESEFTTVIDADDMEKEYKIPKLK